MFRVYMLFFLFMGLQCICYAQQDEMPRFLQGFSVGPTYEFRTVQLKSGFSTNTQDAYQLSSEEPKAGFLVMYTMDIRLGSKGLYLSTGLGYENKGYKSKESDSLFNTFFWNNGSNSQTYASYIANKEVYRYHTLSVPVGLTYKYRHSLLVYSISAGLMFDSPLFYTKVVRYTPTSSYVSQMNWMWDGTEKDRPQEPGNMDFMVNLSIGIHVRKNMLLSIRPGYIRQLYSYDLTTISSRSYSIRLYSFTCPLSLMWSK